MNDVKLREGRICHFALIAGARSQKGWPFAAPAGGQWPQHPPFPGVITYSNGTLVLLPRDTSPSKVSMPESRHTQEPVSQSKEGASARLIRRKAESHDHDNLLHPGHQQRQRRWSSKARMAARSGTALAIKLSLVVAIVAGVLVGAWKVVPYVFHPGSNSTPPLARATATASAIQPGTVAEFPVPAASASGFGGLISGPDGNLWFIERTKNNIDAIGRISPTGTVTQFLFPPGSGSSGPSGLTSGPDGNLWFVKDYHSNKIGRITPAGSITEFPIPTASSESGGITSGPDGNLWFTEEGANKIGRIIPTGNITEFLLPTPFSIPAELISGPDGNLWFTESGSNKIGRITPTGNITDFPVPTGSANYNSPVGLISGPDGNLWFTEVTANMIGRITPAGVITEFPVPLGASSIHGISGISGLISGPDGNLWFIESSNNEIGLIGRINPAGNITEFSLPTASSEPAGLISGPDGNLWFIESSNNEIGLIGRITPAGNITEFPVPLSYADSGVSEIIFGSDGNLWFTVMAPAELNGPIDIGRITP